MLLYVSALQKGEFMIEISRNDEKPMYEQIYDALKDSIESGTYKMGTRLPSIRSMAEQLGVSKITVEQAYLQLSAEGYIKAHHKAPYEVIFKDVLSTWASNGHVEAIRSQGEIAKEEERPIVYNFATGAMDPEGFDFSRWKRHIGYVLRSPERLMAYGDPQGELVLREQLSMYLNDARGVITTPQHMVVSSGSQYSLLLLTFLLKSLGISIVGLGVHDRTVEALFIEAGFKVVQCHQNEDNFVHELIQKGVQCVYCTPSHGDGKGRLMSIGQRQALIRWTHEHDGYIIEDDYDSELRYYGRPILSLQGMGGIHRVIYVGTPSKVLPPSIRLSFMVLPDRLLKLYKEDYSWHRQSASVMDQLVWASYMEAGEWHKQIRRLRKHYLDKSRYMAELLNMYLGHMAQVDVPEGGVYISLQMHGDVPLRVFEEKALQGGCRVRLDGEYILLSFSGIKTKGLRAAVECLRDSWKGIQE